MAKKINPFGEEQGKVILKSLSGLDKASKNFSHNKKYTVDGVLLEKGLKVWCIDYRLGKHPWELQHEFDGDWIMTYGGTKRDAKFRVMYADKNKAITQRIQLLHEEIDKVNQKEIFPRLKEVKELREERDGNE